MYKNYLLVLVLLISGVSLSAQDRLITAAKDTINCKVLGKSHQYLRIRFVQNGETKEVQYPLEYVVSLDKDFYAPSISSLEQFSIQEPRQDRFKIAVNGGMAYRLGRMPESDMQMEDFLKKLRWGGLLEADIHYYSRGFGFGIDCKQFIKSKKQTLYGAPVEDNTRILFIGPSISWRSPLKGSKGTTFTGNLSYGYSHLREKVNAGNFNGKITGGSLGMSLSAGFDFDISEKVAWGIKLSLHAASLGKLHVESGGVRITEKLEDDERENLSFLGLTMGLRFFP